MLPPPCARTVSWASRAEWDRGEAGLDTEKRAARRSDVAGASTRLCIPSSDKEVAQKLERTTARAPGMPRPVCLYITPLVWLVAR